MRPFRYAFAPVLDRAVVVEAQAAAALTRAQAELALERLGMTTIDARLRTARGELSAQRTASAAAFAALDSRLTYLAEQHTRSCERIALCRSRIARARDELAECTRQRRVLERHRERALAAYDATVEAYEQAEIDEANRMSAALTSGLEARRVGDSACGTAEQIAATDRE